jgi:hypothetical protein
MPPGFDVAFSILIGLAVLVLVLDLGQPWIQS